MPHDQESTRPFVSVVVPFYGDPEPLKACVQKLVNQTYPEGRYEILLVDNGQTLRAEDPDFQHPLLTLLREPKAGSYAARNRGIEEARGEILAFTDADCLPEETWLEEGVNALQHASAAYAGGRIKMSYRRPKAPRIAEIYDALFSSFDQEANINDKGFSVTANLFTTPAVFHQVGTFNAALKSRGDLEWGQRVKQAQMAGTYSAKAVVWHPCRHTFKQLHAKARRLTGGHHDRASKQSLALLRHLKWLAVFATVQPLREILFAQREGLAKTLSQRIGVAAYIVTIDWLRVFERLRLILGAESQR